MSLLLDNVKAHLGAANLLDGYRVQFYKWTDLVDTPTFVIRRAGTSGPSDYLVQNPDLRFILITGNANDVAAGEVRMYDILRYLRGNYKSSGVVHYDLLSGIIGPNYLTDGRGVYEMNVRCMTDDQ